MFRKDANQSWTVRAAVAIVMLAMMSARTTADDARSSCRSPHFFVSVDGDPPLAEEIAQAAEHWRKAIANDWIAEPLSSPTSLTFLQVDLSTTTDVGLVMLAADRTERTHRIWIKSSADRAVGSTLAHEIAHVVLADAMHERVPAWAAEGISCQYDDSHRQAVRCEILNDCARLDRWPSVTRLLEAPVISPEDEVAYAVAASLTEYLVALSGRKRFTKFVIDSKRSGWTVALQQTYRVDSIEDLTQRWKAWLINRLDGRKQLAINERWAPTRKPSEP